METREREIIKTSAIGIFGNVLLVCAKAFIGIIANSISIVMDAVNNLTDALSSIITIIGTKISNKRPNKKHPYGYGRIEYITSTLIAILILFAGVMAIYESVVSLIDHIKNDTMPTFDNYSIIIISIAILTKIGIGLFFKHKGNKIESDALKASGTDALYDSILSASTLVGIFVAKFANVYVEGYLGIVIGIFIIKSGLEVLKESLAQMIGVRFEKEYIVDIKNDICNVPGVKGCYDLILNSYGPNKNIGSVHIGVDHNLLASDIQAIERNIMIMMYTKYNTIMTVGIYAENFDDERTKKSYQVVLNILKKYENVLQIHGFFVDEVKKMINYDLVISFDEKDPITLIDNIKKDTEVANPGYKVIINYDQDFSLS